MMGRQEGQRSGQLRPSAKVKQIVRCDDVTVSLFLFLIRAERQSSCFKGKKKGGPSKVTSFVRMRAYAGSFDMLWARHGSVHGAQ